MVQYAVTHLHTSITLPGEEEIMKNKLVFCLILIACISSYASADGRCWNDNPFPNNTIQPGFIDYLGNDLNMDGFLVGFGIRIRQSKHMLGAGCLFIDGETKKNEVPDIDEEHFGIYGQWIYGLRKNIYVRSTLGVINRDLKKKQVDITLINDSMNHGFISLGGGINVVFINCEVGVMMFDWKRSVDEKSMDPKLYFIMSLNL